MIMIARSKSLCICAYPYSYMRLHMSVEEKAGVLLLGEGIVHDGLLEHAAGQALEIIRVPC